MLLFERVYEQYGQSANEATYYYKYDVQIRKREHAAGGTSYILREYWGLTLPLVQKYDWLFRRRAALLQLEHPKSVIFFGIIRQEADPVKARKVVLTNRMRNAKAKVTEFENKMATARQKWNQLFPIDDYEPYQKVAARLFQKRQQLHDLQEELNSLEPI
jgi:hypothetical protein